MYDNIGAKIKSWAMWIFAVEAIVSIIIGLSLIASDDELILIGILLIVLGPLAGLVSSWLLYGYGQLIQNSDIIAAYCKQKNGIHTSKTTKETSAEVITRFANKADYRFTDITCPKCKASLTYPKGQLKSGETITCPMCHVSISLK